MLERKKINLMVLVLDAFLAGGIYIFSEFFCKRECYIAYESNYLEPLFFVLVGLFPILVMLLFFQDKIFVSWVKRVAWWFLIIVELLVMSNNHENDFSIFGDDTFVIGVMMTLLFIITLVYALIMNKKLKEKPNLTCPF